jgi:hypothetical protein
MGNGEKLSRCFIGSWVYLSRPRLWGVSDWFHSCHIVIIRMAAFQMVRSRSPFPTSFVPSTTQLLINRGLWTDYSNIVSEGRKEGSNAMQEQGGKNKGKCQSSEKTKKCDNGMFGTFNYIHFTQKVKVGCWAHSARVH